MLSYRAKYLYVKNPANCPHCGNSNLELEETTRNLSVTTNLIRCKDCGKQWKEVSNLVSIIEIVDEVE